MIRAVVALVVAVALCAAFVFFGPGLAERLVPLLPASQAENYALIETLFVAVIFGAMIVAALVAGRLMGVNPLRMGARPLPSFGLGVAIGAGGLLVAAGYAALSGAAVAGEGGGAGAAMILWGVAAIAVQAGAEEIYFRGWLQPVLQQAWGGAAAVLLTAVAFSGLHIMGGARAPVSLLNLFLGGVMFGLLALKGQGIAAALGAHIAWNATEQLGVGLDPNPGTGSFGAAIDYDLAGRVLWGGSEEGLNASIAMTFALLAIVVPLLMLARRPKAEAKLATSAATG
ncbi:CPBP family intramembrane glutamic endopeptidase [Sphingomonas gilva]|nr:type II CAAX endopeptidase family protein [Sphingomonas gilva]